MGLVLWNQVQEILSAMLWNRMQESLSAPSACHWTEQRTGPPLKSNLNLSYNPMLMERIYESMYRNLARGVRSRLEIVSLSKRDELMPRFVGVR